MAEDIDEFKRVRAEGLAARQDMLRDLGRMMTEDWSPLELLTPDSGDDSGDNSEGEYARLLPPDLPGFGGDIALREPRELAAA